MKIKSFVSLCLLPIAIAAGLGACKGYTPVKGTTKLTSDYSSLNVSAITKCVNGKTYGVKEGSLVSWRATKTTPSGTSETMLGSNAISGSLTVEDNWGSATASLDISGNSTNSESPLRDSRISSFIFNAADALPFGFKLTSIEGDDLQAKDFEEIAVTAVGNLYVGNRSTTIRMPVLIKAFPDSIIVTPSEVFKLNVRSVSPTINGINLVEQIERLLSFVPGVKMNDEVMLDFNLELKQSCN